MKADSINLPRGLNVVAETAEHEEELHEGGETDDCCTAPDTYRSAPDTYRTNEMATELIMVEDQNTERQNHLLQLPNNPDQEGNSDSSVVSATSKKD